MRTRTRTRSTSGEEEDQEDEEDEEDDERMCRPKRGLAVRVPRQRRWPQPVRRSAPSGPRRHS